MNKILKYFREKCKLWWEAHESDVFVIAIIMFLSIIIFGAGRLWLFGSHEIRSREIVIEENAFSAPSPSVAIKNFVASVNGEKYYPAGCKAANRINKENSIWFASEKEAREMGYTPSSQCKK